MKKTIYTVLVWAIVLVSCTVTPTPLTSPQASSVKLTATAILPPTPITDIAASENTGRAFLSAWEQSNYAEMYQFLVPNVRATLTFAEFEAAYRVPLEATTTVSLTLTPQTLELDGEQAWVDFEQVWHTGMFADLQTENRLALAKVASQWWVNWSEAMVWPELAEGNRFAVEYQIPPRANIYDRHGAGLAVPVTLVTVGVIPEQIEDAIAVSAALSLVLGMTTEEIQADYAGKPTNWYIPIGEITGDDSLAYDDTLSLPGIQRRERVGRLYPLAGVGAHVVGWLSPIPAESYPEYRQRDYRGDEYVGISGLEAWAESTLAGQNGGRLYLINAEGAYVRGLAERQPERGSAVHTTLDRDWQAAAEQVLGQRRGAVVALDVATGAILALTSGPSFDNNIFIRPTDELPRQMVLNDANHPLLNRAIQGQYPSGSIFKIVTLAAALSAGDFKPESGFYCPGYWDGLGEPNRKMCWLETGHGNITLENALSASCNVTFYEVGKTLDYEDQNILPTYGSAFGFGVKTGLLELVEAGGLMPNPEWKKETYLTQWGTGDTVNLAIGQGYLLVTPLQVARMVAAVANGGTLYRPYLVHKIAGHEGMFTTIHQPRAVGRLPVSDVHLQVIQDAMWGVTTKASGTATQRFVGLGIPVAGKTGSAEPANAADASHSWFAGYFPADAPEVAMAIVVENAGEGSTVAAPMFRQIMELYYDLALTPLPESVLEVTP